MVSAPPIELTSVPEPSEEECDRVLGSFLRSWDQVEMSLAALLAHLTETNPTTGHIISQAISDWRTRREIIEALGSSRLRRNDLTDLLNLMEQVGRANTKRNRLVHGTWMMVISVHRDKDGKKRAVTGKWHRADIPSDLNKMVEHRANSKVRNQHQFDTQQIANITQSTLKLARSIKTFTSGAALVPYVPPVPLDIS